MSIIANCHAAKVELHFVLSLCRFIESYVQKLRVVYYLIFMGDIFLNKKNVHVDRLQKRICIFTNFNFIFT